MPVYILCRGESLECGAGKPVEYTDEKVREKTKGGSILWGDLLVDSVFLFVWFFLWF